MAEQHWATHLSQGLLSGMQLGQAIRQQRRQGALDDIYRTQGRGILAGDQNALGALAQYDPQGALQFSMVAEQRKAAERKAKQAAEAQRWGQIGGILAGVQNSDNPAQAFQAAKSFAVQRGLLSEQEAANITPEQIPHLINQHRGVEDVIKGSQWSRDYSLNRDKYELDFKKFMMDEVLPAAGRAMQGVGPALGGGSAAPADRSLDRRPTRENAATIGGQPQMQDFANAIASIESRGQPAPYEAVGLATSGGDRAYGKYQVMGANIGPWTREILGQEMTPEEFLANPEAQEAVFAGKFGQYLKQTGSPEDAASMWFTGRPAAEGANRRDVNGTTGADYVRRFSQALGGQGQRAPAQLAQNTGQANDAGGAQSGMAEVLAAIQSGDIRSLGRLSPAGQQALAQMAQATGGDGSEFERLLQTVSPDRRQDLIGQRLNTLAVGKSPVQVNIGQDGKPYPDPPKGHVWARDDNGELILETTADGYKRPIAVPVGSEARKAESEAQAETFGQQKKFDDLRRVEGQVVTVLTDLEKGEYDGFFTTGMGAPIGQMIPGSRAERLELELRPIIGDAALGALMSLKESSPTGASGLGALSQRELDLLQAVQGALEQTQPDLLKRNLRSYLEFLRTKRYRQNIAYAEDVKRWGQDYVDARLLAAGIDPQQFSGDVDAGGNDSDRDRLKSKYGLE